MRPVWRLAIAAVLAATMGATTSRPGLATSPDVAGSQAVSSQAVPTDALGKPQSIVRLAQQDAYRADEDYGASAQTGVYRPDEQRYGSRNGDSYAPSTRRVDDAYRPPYRGDGYGSDSAYNSGPAPYPNGDRHYRDDAGPSDAYRGRTAPPSGGYGSPYAPPSEETASRHDFNGYPEPRGPDEYDDNKYYSKNEIIAAGHGFFGSISQGLASVIEHAFKKAGRPNGYILGEDAGGAFVAGLRYGEGRLYTKDAGNHKVYWQGPSIGYDFGGAGAKTMILVYNLRDPSEVYHRYGGVEGSAYLVGGVSIQFQKYGDVVMAPIRAGVGLRLGANVGYLKYTRTPTWNPF